MTPKQILKKYPAPKTNEEYVRRWNTFIPEIVSRDNFKPAHLFQLEVLCDLYVEYKELQDVIEMIGRTHSDDTGRYGNQTKLRPEVTQLNKVRAEIASYTKILGLLLYKDKVTTAEEEEKEEWS
jgi:phage terminase small subunit